MPGAYSVPSSILGTKLSQREHFYPLKELCVYILAGVGWGKEERLRFRLQPTKLDLLNHRCSFCHSLYLADKDGSR